MPEDADSQELVEQYAVGGDAPDPEPSFGEGIDVPTEEEDAARKPRDEAGRFTRVEDEEVATDEGGEDADAAARDEDRDAEADDESRQQLADRARALGLTKDEIETAGDGLEPMLRLLESAFEDAGDEGQEARTQPESESGDGEDGQERESERREADRQSEPEPELNLDELLDGFDEESADALRQIHSATSGQANKAVQAVESLVERVQAMEAAHWMDNVFDPMVSRLGDEYQDVLGDGPFRLLDPESDEAQTRQKILDTMDVIFETRSKRNLPTLSHDDLFKEAADIVLKDHKQTKAAKKRDRRVKRRAKSYSRPPSRRERSPERSEMTPAERDEAETQRAVAAVRREAQERGHQFDEFG